MKRIWLGLAVAALAVLGVAPSAHAANGDCRLIRGAETPTDPTDDVTVCRQDVWLHQGAQRLGNLSGSQFDATGPTWSTTAPTGAYPASGSMYVAAAEYDIFVSQDPTGRPIFNGTFTGPIDSIGFQVYLRSPFYEAESSPFGAELALTIDGQTLYDNFNADAGVDIPMHAAGNLQVIDGEFTNIYDVLVADGIDVSPTATHTISFGINSWYFPGDTFVFYDATDAPSGLIFNLEPENAAGYTPVDVAAVQ